jgi:hypothetical protein
MLSSGEIIFLDEIHDYFSSNLLHQNSKSKAVAEPNSVPTMNISIPIPTKASCSTSSNMNSTSDISHHRNMLNESIDVNSNSLNENENHDWKSKMKFVRVTGHITYIDTAKRFCEISHSGYSLHIDMSICDGSGIRLDHLCQFIGELRERKV